MTTITDNNGSSPTDQDVQSKFQLKIQPAPPRFPFVNSSFDIHIYLVESTGEQLKRGSSIPLKIQLLDADSLDPISPKDACKILSPKSPKINQDGMCTVQICITTTSMSSDNRNFVLSAKADESGDMKVIDENNILPAISPTMTVVQHRLVIQSSLPELWYKDEGGRDKCMELPVLLIDGSGNRVTNREVQLKVSLWYEDEGTVLKQSILKLSPDSQRIIDNKGEAFIRFRIEDVSKNHQGQGFRVKVEADTQHSPLNFDISYDFSSVISIRSKRNKRARTKAAAVTSAIPTPLSTNTTSSSTGAGGGSIILDRPVEHTSNGFKLPPPSSATVMPQQSTEQEGIVLTEDLKKNARDATANMVTSSISSTNATGNNNPLQVAMSGVLHWTSTVVNGLHALEWQLVGYESKPDGTPDTNRPLYRCPSCWRYKDVLTFHTAQHGRNCVLANVLMQYSTTSMMQLNTLLRAVDATSNTTTTNHILKNSTTTSTNIPSNVSFRSNAASNNNDNNTTIDPATSSTVPPPLARGLTELTAGAPLSLLQGASSGMFELEAFGDDKMEDHFNNYMAQQQAMDAMEMRVYYLLAKMQQTEMSGTIGFPAFDHNQQLLGYYRYQEGQLNTATEVIFIPLSKLQGSMTQRDVSDAHTMFMTEAKTNSGAVFSLPKCDNNLVKLKESALNYHWGYGVGW